MVALAVLAIVIALVVPFANRLSKPRRRMKPKDLLLASTGLLVGGFSCVLMYTRFAHQEWVYLGAFAGIGLAVFGVQRSLGRKADIVRRLQRRRHG